MCCWSEEEAIKAISQGRTCRVLKKSDVKPSILIPPEGVKVRVFSTLSRPKEVYLGYTVAVIVSSNIIIFAETWCMCCWS